MNKDRLHEARFSLVHVILAGFIGVLDDDSGCGRWVGVFLSGRAVGGRAAGNTTQMRTE